MDYGHTASLTAEFGLIPPIPIGLFHIIFFNLANIKFQCELVTV